MKVLQKFKVAIPFFLIIIFLIVGDVGNLFGQEENIDLIVFRKKLIDSNRPPIVIAMDKGKSTTKKIALDQFKEFQDKVKQDTGWNYPFSLTLECYFDKELEIIDWDIFRTSYTNNTGIPLNYAISYSLCKESENFIGNATVWYLDTKNNLEWKMIAQFSDQDASIQQLAVSLARKIRGSSGDDIEKKVAEQNKVISEQGEIIKQLQKDIASLINGKENDSPTFLSTICDDTKTGVTNKFLPVPGSKLVLTKGTWLVGYDVCLDTTISAGMVAIQARLLDKPSGSDYLAGTLAYGACMHGEICANTSRRTKLEVDKDTIIELVIRCNACEGNGNFRILGSGCNESVVWAQKLK